MTPLETLVERVLENKNFNALLKLSTENSIRQLDAHKINNSKTRFYKALVDLGIQASAISNNYADVIWQVYDRIDEMFKNLNLFLRIFYNLKRFLIVNNYTLAILKNS